mmetsp:Transcript_105696/g.340740  ORF Transcript_105696/g.340740 Transcript_105696/m.340740 type:complete len:209 (-) Transcript_105696:726-1352(-)
MRRSTTEAQRCRTTPRRNATGTSPETTMARNLGDCVNMAWKRASARSSFRASSRARILKAASTGGIEVELKCTTKPASFTNRASGASSQTLSAMSASGESPLWNTSLPLPSAPHSSPPSSSDSAPVNAASTAFGAGRAVPATLAALTPSSKCARKTWRANWCSVHSIRCAPRSPRAELATEFAPRTDAVAELLFDPSMVVVASSYFSR